MYDLVSSAFNPEHGIVVGKELQGEAGLFYGYET